MSRTFLHETPVVGRAQAPAYPEDLLPEFQATLGALADIELRFDLERDGLDARAQSGADGQRMLSELEMRRGRAREPHMRRLAELQQRVTTLSAGGFGSTVH